VTELMRTVGFDPGGAVRVCDRAVPQPGARQVIVEVQYAGVNPTDDYQRHRVSEGLDAGDRTPGVEVAGVVRSRGAGVRRWSVGDNVFGLVKDGGLGECVLADEDLLMPVPYGLDPREAAAIPEVFITAHDGLNQGMLSFGETLLVTGASGCVGMAAVQLGVKMGARVLGLARRESGRDRLAALGAEPYPAHADFAPADLPYRDSVDVVIELVGACNARNDLSALRRRGRIVFIGAQGDEDVCVNLREFKTKRATMIGTTLRRRGKDAKVAAVRRFEREALPFIESGELRAAEAHTVPITQAARAFDLLRAPRRHGKVLIAF